MVSSPPHLGEGPSSASLVLTVTLCLLPAAGWGILAFGPSSAFILLTAVGAALGAELLSTLPFGRFTLGDGSALLTGLLVGMMMPPGAPLAVPAMASAFSILVVKQSFGGLGRNWMNPALGGTVFALYARAEAMSRWIAPFGAAAQPVLTPLEALRAALLDPTPPKGNPFEVLSARGYSFSAFDARVLGWVNGHILSPLGLSLPNGLLDLALGNVAGPIGTVSVPLLLLGAGFLLARRIVAWQVPVTYIATFGLLTWVLGGLPEGRGWMRGAVVFHLLAGGLIIGAFFMATDPVTSPLTAKGKMIYGTWLGALTFMLRFFGSLSDGVPLAIILGNCFVPFIDRFTRPVDIGVVLERRKGRDP